MVITFQGGTNRVFSRGTRTLSPGRDDRTIVDERRLAWTVSDEALTGPDDERLPLVPTHRAFWFGWVAQHPDTRLIP